MSRVNYINGTHALWFLVGLANGEFSQSEVTEARIVAFHGSSQVTLACYLTLLTLFLWVLLT